MPPYLALTKAIIIVLCDKLALVLGKLCHSLLRLSKRISATLCNKFGVI